MPYQHIPEGTWIPNDALHQAFICELRPFDPSAFPVQPIPRSVCVDAIPPLHPAISPPADSKEFLLRTYHKFDETRRKDLNAIVRLLDVARRLGVVKKAWFRPDPSTGTVYLTVHYEVVEGFMHPVLREVERLGGFLGSRLPRSWLHSSYCETQDGGRHKVFFDPEEDEEGRWVRVQPE
ncbi:hypothetical protein PSEUBRA_002525 [Kalmanozyma brasiliensis GHG001]|uniref:uncharacterized protein n=1 Tax=Kalmanozyma brasiliensis (strain GHG001) TaxID=1365824 RepID=UPI002867D1C5|nr:uncharacterized protein PSEUBRA_002525 [Kalmanozyma brasiliensis GHG001]KAF6767095.1 hypothetical protein PSEUBRA_002525 [Kalmanozyma brasiliensis GHG001]